MPIQNVALELSIFSARRKIISHEIMQVRLIGIPTPTTIFSNRDIGRRIVIEGLESLVAFEIAPVAKVAMPEVKQVAIQERRLGADHLVEGLRPGHEVLLLPVIRIVNFARMIEATIGRGGKRADRTSNDASIVYAVPLEHLLQQEQCPTEYLEVLCLQR